MNRGTLLAIAALVTVCLLFSVWAFKQYYSASESSPTSPSITDQKSPIPVPLPPALAPSVPQCTVETDKNCTPAK
jgi:hypothetical protein